VEYFYRPVPYLNINRADFTVDRKGHVIVQRVFRDDGVLPEYGDMIGAPRFEKAGGEKYSAYHCKYEGNINNTE
jgi:hypothetical protein